MGLSIIAHYIYSSLSAFILKLRKQTDCEW